MTTEAIADNLVNQEAESRAYWLGGFFEVGGSIGVDLAKDRRSGSKIPYAAPFMKFSDNSEERADTFIETFGGNKYRYRNSWMVFMHGFKAVSLTNTLSSFAPSRRELADVFKRWKYLSAEERYQHAKVLKGYRRRKISEMTKDDYIELIGNPEFVAGVVDNRGILRIPKNRLSPIIRVPSMNVPLLEALKIQYGGTLRFDDGRKEARSIFFRGLEPNRVPPSRYWEMYERDTVELITSIKPHLLLRNREVERLLAA